MYAAASGNSNLGIPKSVGEEFVKSDSVQDPPEAGDVTDYEAMEMVRDGELPSPTKYGDFWLFDVRVTGTGLAFREALGEWALRDPELWTSDELVKRVASLPVIVDHPEGTGLTSEEYRERNIGSIFIPYVKDDEVWGIAKIFDEDGAVLMQTTHRSTSPGVMPPKGSVATPLNNGTKVLDEGLPLVFDHLAICEAGVWDKDGPPIGIRLDSTSKGEAVTEEEKREDAKRDDARKSMHDGAKHDGSHKDCAHCDAKEKMDAAEKEFMDAKARHDEMEPLAREDAEETDKEELAAAEKGKADKRKDSEKSEDEEAEKKAKELEEHERKEREDKAKKDRKDEAGAKEEEPDADHGTEMKEGRLDSKKLDAMIDRRARALINEMHKPLTVEDRTAIMKVLHRADGLFQKLGESAPQPMPGETPRQYRHRLASALRPFTDHYKAYVFHDAILKDHQTFDVVEKNIYDEAEAHAKNPATVPAGTLREVVDDTTMFGKRITNFFGDAKTAWLPFMPPVRNLVRKIDSSAGQQQHR